MEVATDISQIKVWVYRSVKKLNPEVENEILKSGQAFVDKWASHGKKLSASFEILYHHFLIFKVDQNWAQASGCSIDSSVGFIRDLDAQLNLGLLDRLMIGFMANDEVVFHPFGELKELFESGAIKKEQLVFNHLVQNLSEFQSQFIIPFSESPFYSQVS